VSRTTSTTGSSAITWALAPARTASSAFPTACCGRSGCGNRRRTWTSALQGRAREQRARGGRRRPALRVHAQCAAPSRGLRAGPLQPAHRLAPVCHRGIAGERASPRTPGLGT
jgi:hypothetical protein